MAKQYINTSTGEMSTDLSGVHANIPKKGGKVKGIVTSDIPELPDELKDVPGLQDVNNNLEKSFRSAKYDPGHYYQQFLPGSTEFIGDTGVGTSKYDKGITNRSQLEDLGNTRGELQPWYDQVGGSIIKGTVTAGTTFLDNTLGLIVAAGTTPTNGYSAIAGNNPFSQAMVGIQNSIKDYIPFYETDKQQNNESNGDWYKNLLSPTYVFNQLADQVGFTVGALGAGAIFGAGIGALGSKLGVVRDLFTGMADESKIASTMEKLYSGESTMASADIASTATKNAKSIAAMGWTKGITGAALGAQGEARFEAINNTNDWKQLQNQQIDQQEGQYRQQLEQVAQVQAQQEGVSVDSYSQHINDLVSQKFNPLRQEVEKRAMDMGNNIFNGNMVLLTLSNMLEFGKFLSGGYKTAASTASKYITPELNEAGKLISTSVNKRTAKDILGSGIKNILSEGNEEMMQQSISTGAGLQQSAKINSFYGAKINPDATSDMENGWNALGEGIKQTYSDPKQWEQFFYGGIMGGIGLPTLHKNAEGKWRLQGTGGFAEGMRENKENVEYANEVSSNINNSLNNDKLQNYLDGITRNKYYDNQMDEAAKNKDNFSFKNAEHASLVNAAIMFDRAGRIQDLYNMIDSASSIKDEDLPIIKQQVQDKEGKSVFDGKTDDEIKDFVKKQATNHKESIDKYRTLASNLTTQLGDNFKGDKLDEMVYMMSHVDNLEDRFKQIHQDLKKSITDSTLKDIEYRDELGNSHTISESLNSSPLALLQALTQSHQQLHEQSVKDATNLTNQVERLNNKTDKRGINVMVDNLNRLSDAVNKNTLLKGKFQEQSQQIEDLHRIVKNRIDFLNKYNGYLYNPQSLDKDIAKETEDANIIKKDKDQSVIKDKLTNSQNYQEYKDNLNNVDDSENPKLKQSIVKDLADSEHPLSKIYQQQKNTRDSLNSIISNKPQDESTELAKRLVNRTFKDADENTDIADINNRNYNKDLELDDNGQPYDNTTLNSAKTHVIQAINTINNSRKNKANAEVLTPQTETETVKPVKTSITPVVETTKEDVNKETTVLNKDLKVKEATKLQEVSKDSNNKELLKYWIPTISEYPITPKNEGDFSKNTAEAIPSLEKVYEYLEKNGAFAYVNEGKLKPGDKIYFVINNEIKEITGEKFSPILIATENKNSTGANDKYQILGLLSDKKSISDKYIGMSDLRRRIIEKYDSLNPSEKEFYVHDETTTVGSVEPGRLKITKEDNNLNEVNGVVNSNGIVNSNLKFGIITSNQFKVPNTSNLQFISPQDLNNGRLYLAIKGGDNKYYPLMVRTKNFDSSFNPSDMSIINANIRKVLENVVNGADITGTNGGLKGELRKILYFDEDKFFIDKIQQNSFSLDTDEEGNWDQNKNKTSNEIIQFRLQNDDGSEITKQYKIDSSKSIDENIDNLMSLLQSYGFHYQVNANELNTPSYNSYLVKANILTANTDRLNTVANYPFINPILSDGSKIEAELPKYTNETTPSNSNVPTATGTNEPNYTEIVHKEGKLFVDLTNNKIYKQDDKKGYIEQDIKDAIEKDTIRAKAFIKSNWNDLQWKKERVNGDNVLVNKEFNKIFNIKTESFLTSEEEIKNFYNKLYNVKQDKAPSTSSPSLFNRLGNNSLKVDNKTEETLTKNNIINSEEVGKIAKFANLSQEIKDSLSKFDVSDNDWDNVFTEEERKNTLDCLGF